MIKRTIKETVREYDDQGILLRETITETSEEDNTDYMTTYSTHFLIEDDKEDDISKTIDTFIN